MLNKQKKNKRTEPATRGLCKRSPQMAFDQSTFEAAQNLVADYNTLHQKQLADARAFYNVVHPGQQQIDGYQGIGAAKVLEQTAYCQKGSDVVGRLDAISMLRAGTAAEKKQTLRWKCDKQCAQLLDNIKNDPAFRDIASERGAGAFTELRYRGVLINSTNLERIHQQLRDAVLSKYLTDAEREKYSLALGIYLGQIRNVKKTFRVSSGSIHHNTQRQA